MANAVPSGRQFEIALGTQRATVVEVGGGVRAYEHGGRPVLHPYDVSMICDGAHGTPLIPWPNRLEDGRYRYRGVEHQLPITEPAKSNAIHGLLRWRPWRAIRHQADRVTMATTLHPREGFPFEIEVEVDYRLGGDGLTVATTATNNGQEPCPYGCGQHPYLSPGHGIIDECLLEFQAGTRIVTDQRQLPLGTEAVADGEFDFSRARRLGDLQIDHAFADLARDQQDRAWVSLTGPDGCTAALWLDGAYPYLEVFTADGLDDAERRRRGLGVEPMSSPPNALATGEAIVDLEPDQSAVHTWGVQLLD